MSESSLGSLRIAMVSSRFLPFFGGVETHVDEVASRMAARGLDVTVLTIDLSGRLPAFEERSGYQVRRFPAWRLGRDLEISRGLSREIVAGGYDILHLQGVHTLVPFTALAAARRADCPAVVTFHSGGHSSRLRTAGREMQWRALGHWLRQAGAVIAVSEYEAQLFARMLRIDRADIRLIRNGVEPLPVADANPEVSGSPLICSIGRLERYKGHDRVIAAMPALLEIAPRAHLAIVGHGSYELQLRRLVRHLRLEGAVSFLAFDVSRRPELGSLVRSCDVVVLMSKYESSGLVVMEALGLGRRVVVAATSGLAELARGGLVTAIPCDVSPAILAETLARTATEPAPDRNAEPLELAGWDDCVSELLDLYGIVTSKRERILKTGGSGTARRPPGRPRAASPDA